MSTFPIEGADASPVAARARALFTQMMTDIHRRTDHLFAGLLLLEWLGAIAVAVLVSPLTWSGQESQIHIHVWAALILGGAIISFPVALALARPGATVTRHVIAVGQMLMGALLIHLSGGRIETHFHVFGSLAFLAFYRDWPVIVTASLVASLDHWFRGTYWPRSIFGVLTSSPWRWVEHGGWVVFEDIFLVQSCVQMVREMRDVARHRTELEDTRAQIERTVVARTGELYRANGELTHEVTVRQRTEVELKNAKDAAEAASRVKSEFLANMSHEIRTPMNGIIGMTDLALETELTRRQREYLGLVKSSAESLMTVINDILDFSKIEAGKLSLDSVPFALRDVMGETLHTLALRAHAKGLELACRISPEVPEAVIGDGGRLRQVVVNLVGNAIKFTEQGEVVVAVMPDDVGDRGIGLRFSISDTGIGIPRDKAETIFEPFEQADGSTTRRFGGTGLGLAISAKLVGMMDGQIWVDSEPGRGSTFWFTVVLGQSTPDVACRVEPEFPRLEGVRVLIVDDNATNRMILAEVVSNWGLRPVAVDGGMPALRALRAAAERGQPYPVALIDGMMPGMDGLDLAEHIRSEPSIAGVRLLLLTSAGRPDDTARYRLMNIAACLTKPVRQSELFDALMKAMAPSGRSSVDLSASHGAQVRSGSIAPGERLRILLAEDHPVNQKVAVHMLERMGHSVVVASDGRRALDALDASEFDVILMDLQMPEMDGFEAVRAIRQREAESGRHTTTLALTAHAMQGDRERCLEAGFDGHLAKPIRQVDLQAALAAGRRPGHGGQGPEHPVVSRLNSICEGDGDFVRELAGAFLESAPQCLADLERAVCSGNGRQVDVEAHGLKGISQSIGAEEMAAICQLLEDAANRGDFESASTEMARVGREWKQVRPVLEHLITNRRGG